MLHKKIIQTPNSKLYITIGKYITINNSEFRHIIWITHLQMDSNLYLFTNITNSLYVINEYLSNT